MKEGKWTPFEDNHTTIDAKSLGGQKQHEDYELEAELKEDEKKDLGFKKLNLDLKHIFRNREN